MRASSCSHCSTALRSCSFSLKSASRGSSDLINRTTSSACAVPSRIRCFNDSRASARSLTSCSRLFNAANLLSTTFVRSRATSSVPNARFSWLTSTDGAIVGRVRFPYRELHGRFATLHPILAHHAVG